MFYSRKDTNFSTTKIFYSGGFLQFRNIRMIVREFTETPFPLILVEETIFSDTCCWSVFIGFTGISMEIYIKIIMYIYISIYSNIHKHTHTDVCLPSFIPIYLSNPSIQLSISIYVCMYLFIYNVYLSISIRYMSYVFTCVRKFFV